MQSDNDGESSIDEKNEDQEGVMLHRSMAGCSYRESSIDEKNEDQEGVMLHRSVAGCPYISHLCW